MKINRYGSEFQITQFDCNYDNLAPDGCTQWFYGQTTDQVKTYNFDGGAHLASQNQNICVRRERNTCRICWATTAEGDFELTTAMTGAAGTGKFEFGCCNYGTMFSKTATGYDCAKIPIPTKEADSATLKNHAYGFCGGEFGTDGTIAAGSVCCKLIKSSI